MPRFVPRLLLLAVLATPGAAQEAPSPAPTLSPGDRVRVRLDGYAPLEGTFVRSDADSFHVARQPGGEGTYAFSRIRVGAVERYAGRRTDVGYAAGTGAIGAAGFLLAAYGLAALMNSADDGDWDWSVERPAVAAAVGFGVGFVLGLTAKRDKWERVELPAGGVTPLLDVGEEVTLGVSISW